MKRKISILSMFSLLSVSLTTSINPLLNLNLSSEYQIVNEKKVNKSKIKLKKLNATKTEVIGIGTVLSGFIFKDNNLYLEKFNFLWSINANDQTIITSIMNLGLKVSDLTFFNNKLYLASGKSIYCVDLVNKTKVKIADFDSFVLALKFINKKLIVTTFDAKLYQIDSQFNNIEKVVNLAFPRKNLMISSLAYNSNNNLLYAGTFSGKVYKFDQFDRIVEIADLNSPVSSLVFKDQKLYAGVHNDKIYQIDETQKVISEVIDVNGLVSYLTVENNQLYAATQTGKFYQINF